MTARLGGWAGWLMKRLARKDCAPPRLELLERLALAPRQSLALIEADGRRILVATSAEGGPAFYPLDPDARVDARIDALLETPAKGRTKIGNAARVSW
jgi:flagellar biogenesis protein FliO